jgi:catechol 2,3-dioxygenase-like lactoylglutathione lyase family enzyme
MSAPRLRPDQIGILVPDLERAIETYSALFGIAEWRAWTYGPELVPKMTYLGAPARYEMELALTDTTPQIELIQPLSGRSIYTDWIERHGYGLHHVGTVVEKMDEAAAQLTAAGFSAIQSGSGYGRDGDGAYAYFDALDALGLVVELIEVPSVRREPHWRWRDGRREP